ncbi:MAG: FtsX-like permease family protein [Rubrivivax sp.]
MKPPLVLTLFPLVLREWRHHPWRHGVAVLAVALGVALAWSVHVINASALAEFSAAVRSANGEPDAVLRGPPEGFSDEILGALSADPDIELASPVLELETYAFGADGRRWPVKVLGVDALAAAPLTPQLLPAVAGPGAEGEAAAWAALDPGAAFLNAAARNRLGLQDGDTLRLQAGPTWQTWRVAGSVPASGTPMVVLDVASAQAAFGSAGRLSRVDLRLAPGASRAALQQRLQPALGPSLQWASADESEQRVSNLSRAYRVNLTVLALVALFVGAFLVYSVVALSVAQRTPFFALLGVLGLTAAERRSLVLLECGALGVAGSALGLALGTGMAAAALRWLAGDLGGGYFPGIAPSLQVSALALAGFGALGVAAALVGGWVPARHAQALQPAVALKGLGAAPRRAPPAWPGLALVLAGGALALTPALAGLPIGAYLAVAALLCGGIALVPAVVHALLAGVPRPRGALPLLALQRARMHRQTATAAVAGVVASLALSVALTVMVTSFRTAVAQWLDTVLPADLYARTAATGSLADQAWLDDAYAQGLTALPGVRRVEASRIRALQLAAGRPAVALVARPLADPAASLALLVAPLPAHPTRPGAFVSEAMVTLYGAAPGQPLRLELPGAVLELQVRGVFRDYARQFGTVVMDRSAYAGLTGDHHLNDLALWLAPDTDAAAVQAAMRAAAPDPGMLEFATATELRRISLAIFDRSFAVTTYLQLVAIGIGLVGVAASLSAQVLARRKEFGLLAHLGLTRRDVTTLVAGEAAAWMAAGVLIGLLLGLAVSTVLVHVVNPQSFHWTMALVVPPGRLAALALLVGVAGVATSAFSARHAASRQAVLAVKEDW